MTSPRAASLVALLLAVVVVAPPAALASPGDADAAFGASGEALHAFPTPNSRALASVQDAGGTLVQVGTTDGVPGAQIAAVRWTAAGALDPSWSDDGAASFTLPGFASGELTAAARQPDGKIVAAGLAQGSELDSTSWRLLAVRLTTDGRLDPSFDGDGIVTLAVSGHRAAMGFAIAVQGDGKVLLAGSAVNTTTSFKEFVVARLDALGAPDASFAGDGVTTTQLGSAVSTGGGATARGIVLRADGTIVAGGDAETVLDGTTTTAFALARYLPDGSLDPAFSGDGSHVQRVGDGGASGYDLLQQDDGKLVLAGTASFPKGYAYAIARFTSGGAPDQAFSADGIADIPFAGATTGAAHAVAQQSDGKLVVSGQIVASGYRIGLARLELDGALDSDYGSGGLTSFTFAGAPAFAQDSDLAIDRDDRALVTARASDSAGTEYFAAARRVATAPEATPINARPTVSMTLSSRTPARREAVTATATASDPDGSVASYAWDTDGDGFDDGTGSTVTARYARLGPATIAVRVTDDADARTEAAEDLHVRNIPPLAALATGAARTDQPLVLDASQSRDDDGRIARFEFDVDGNGHYEREGAPARIEVDVDDPGPRVVRVRVTDNDGTQAVAERAVDVQQGCLDRARVGRSEVTTTGCFGRQGGRLTTTDEVRVHGLRLRSRTPVVVDTGQATVAATDATVSVGDTVLNRSHDAKWSLRRSSLSVPVAGGGALAGLPVTGTATVTPRADDSGAVKVDTRLPPQFNGATGTTELEATNDAGVRDETLVTRVPRADVGGKGKSGNPLGDWLSAADPLTSRHAELRYHSELARWRGQMDVQLPGLRGFLESRIGIDNDGLRLDDYQNVVARARGTGVQVLFANIKVDLASVTISSSFSAFAGSDRADDPYGVGMRVSGGYTRGVLCCSGWHGDGFLKVGMLAGSGTAKLSDTSLELTGRMRMGAPSSVELDAQMKASWIRGGSLSASGSGVYNLFGVSVAEADVLATSRGVAACGGKWLFKVGFRQRPGRKAEPMMGCDLSSWLASASRASTARAAAVQEVVTVPAGMPLIALRAVGRGAAPRVRVSGPGGREIVSPEDRGAIDARDHMVMHDGDAATTYVAILRPAPGRWTVEALDGELVRVDRSHAKPAPRVVARVHGRGARRTLRYQVRVAPGETVRFEQQGPDGSAPIGRARASRGTLRFRPLPGRARRRDVVAFVEDGGIPRRRLRVASFQAGRPRSRRIRVKGRLRGPRASVSWRKVAGAARYSVLAVFTDGSTRLVDTRRTRLALRTADKRLQLGVVAVRADGRRIGAGRVTVKRATRRPAAKRRRARGRR